MLIGYMRVSKADGSQATDLQRDALIAVGVDPAHLYEDQASGTSMTMTERNRALVHMAPIPRPP